MEDRPSNGTGNKSWFGRLGQALLGEPRDQNELVELLRDAEQRDLLDAEALSMIEGVMQVADMKVRDIMIPRAQMVVVDNDWPIDEILRVAMESGHSRLPVVGENRDEVQGILLVKDLLRFFADAERRPTLRDFLRPARFIPESKRLNTLLREFRVSRIHMAIVIDEYGGVTGLVTIEDVLEQIVGDIDDEHDAEDDSFVRAHGDGHYMVKARTPIEDFNEYFGTDFSDEEFDTIGGLLMQKLGRLPRRGDRVDVDGLQFEVVRADNRRVHLLGLTLGSPAPPTS